MSAFILFFFALFDHVQQEYLIVGVMQWFSHFCFGETYGYKRTARYLVPVSLVFIPATCLIIAIMDPQHSLFVLVICTVQIGL